MDTYHGEGGEFGFVAGMQIPAPPDGPPAEPLVLRARASSDGQRIESAPFRVIAAMEPISCGWLDSTGAALSAYAPEGAQVRLRGDFPAEADGAAALITLLEDDVTFDDQLGIFPVLIENGGAEQPWQVFCGNDGIGDFHCEYFFEVRMVGAMGGCTSYMPGS